MSEIKINKPAELDPIRRSQSKDVAKPEPASTESEKKSVSSSSDKLDFSNRAAEVGELVEEIKNLPDVRIERVEEIKQQIEDDNFEPSAGDIANAVIREEG